ncbi:Leucine-rich repeat - like 10, partial [Theobroma cacao]
SFSGNLLHDNASYPCTLETLDLSFNSLSKPIPRAFFDSCDHLTSLNLFPNSIYKGSFYIGSSLLELDLSSNLISDFSILKYLFSNCENVKLLNLSYNKLFEKVDKLSSCKNLSILDLTNNLLSRDIPALLFVDLARSLKFLDISHNNLSVNFFMLDFGGCLSFWYRYSNLLNNALYGSGIPHSLINYQLLKNLDLSHIQLQDIIPATLGNLKHLNLANNDYFGNIPPELGWTCSTLVELDHFKNKLSGAFPKTLKSCDSLQSLYLGNNQLFENFLITVITSLPGLQILEVPFNNISGFCSSSASFSSLQKLLLARNFLSGTVPLDIGNCKKLRTIALSLNNPRGSIPPNRFLYTDIGTLPKLTILQLNHNSFIGRIPPELGSCQSLLWLDLNNNHLTGNIPSDLANQVKEIAIRPTLCSMWKESDQKSCIILLDSNSCTTVRLYYGLTMNFFTSNGSMIYLNLSSNLLSGLIPDSLSLMSFLFSLPEVIIIINEKL